MERGLHRGPRRFTIAASWLLERRVGGVQSERVRLANRCVDRDGEPMANSWTTQSERRVSPIVDTAVPLAPRRIRARLAGRCTMP
jgi:hypothetical protein